MSWVNQFGKPLEQRSMTALCTDKRVQTCYHDVLPCFEVIVSAHLANKDSIFKSVALWSERTLSRGDGSFKW